VDIRPGTSKEMEGQLRDPGDSGGSVEGERPEE